MDCRLSREAVGGDGRRALETDLNEIPDYGIRWRRRAWSGWVPGSWPNIPAYLRALADLRESRASCSPVPTGGMALPKLIPTGEATGVRHPAIPGHGGIEEPPRHQSQKLTENAGYLSHGRSPSQAEMCSCWNFSNLPVGHPQPPSKEPIWQRVLTLRNAIKKAEPPSMLTPASSSPVNSDHPANGVQLPPRRNGCPQSRCQIRAAVARTRLPQSATATAVEKPDLKHSPLERSKVDLMEPLDSVQISLMHGVQAQEIRTALRTGAPPFPVATKIKAIRWKQASPNSYPTRSSKLLADGPRSPSWMLSTSASYSISWPYRAVRIGAADGA